MTKIKELSEGERITEPLLVSQVLRGVTNTGSPYLSLTLQDRSGSIDAKYWDVNEATEQKIKPGEVMMVHADVLKYKNNLQLKVISMKEIDQTTLELSDFVTSSKYDKESLKDKITGFVATIQDRTYRKLVEQAILINEESFYTYPAASKNHHDFVGGLATHIYGMLLVAQSLCNIYPELNRDLLYAGVITHDIGKIVEYNGPILKEYSTEGKLIGHISLMNAYIYEIAVNLGVEQSEQVMLLRHLILSHHGQYDYGSPVLPMVPEAEMLNLIDNIDARMNMLDKAFETIEPGTFTPRIFSLENRSFYKEKGTSE